MGSEKRKNRKVRRAVKQEPCCACGKEGSDPSHIRTWKVTQNDNPVNIIPLCRPCHIDWHKSPMRFLKKNERVEHRIRAQGWEILQHPFDPNKLLFVHEEVK